jgi:hypothetical protein
MYITTMRPNPGAYALSPRTGHAIRPVSGAGAYAIARTTMRKPIEVPLKPGDAKALAARRAAAKQAPCRECGSMRGVRNNGRQPLATFYSGLMDQVKLMKSHSVNLSVRA